MGRRLCSRLWKLLEKNSEDMSTWTNAPVHGYAESAQDQYVTTFRQTDGKPYPSFDWKGLATSWTCSRTLSCSSGE